MPESGEIPVYPMTAIDEITTRTPDALFNGTAVTDVIKSCIPDIIDPWKINSTDLDAILIAIKTASQGSEMDMDSQCPACDEVSSYKVNLVSILGSLKAADYSKELQVGELTVKFRPLTYKEMNEAGTNQFQLQKFFQSLDNITDETERNIKLQEGLASVTKITMKVLSETIEHVNSPVGMVTDKNFILDFLENCDKNIYAAIRDFNTDLKEQTELKPLKVKCIHCQHDYEQGFTLNMSDFFA